MFVREVCLFFLLYAVTTVALQKLMFRTWSDALKACMVLGFLGSFMCELASFPEEFSFAIFVASSTALTMLWLATMFYQALSMRRNSS